MKKTQKLIPILLMASFFLLAFLPANEKYDNPESEKTTVKCLVQMVNYSGEGAYVVISLIDADNEYKETLYVQGKDPEWYSDITEWWKFYGKRRPDIDAISGETVAGGERTMNIIQIPSDKIDAGYSLRFETAVEDQEYHVSDVQFELTSENINSKQEGNGWIRYVRMMAQ